MDYSKRQNIEEIKQKRLWQVVASFNIVLIIFLVSYSVILARKESRHTEEAHRPNHELNLVNPGLSNFDLTATSEELRKNVSAFFESKTKSGDLVDYGFFFRDLGTGHGVGVNEHSTFVPASLLKLPTAMAYYKHAESEPEILDKELIFTGNNALMNSQSIPPKERIEVGKSYTVRELIRRSLQYSDNQANTLLVDNIDDAEYARVFEEIDLELPQTPEDEVMTVKAYASVFRNLYNSNYLKLNYSQEILSFMTESDYDLGIKSGIPDFVKLANKFGERKISDQSTYLHDCGIVYSNHPYIICIMTKGKDMQALTQVISETSEMVYETMGD